MATVTIADNDIPAVTVTATDASAGESVLDPGTFTFSRTGPTTSALTVSYSVGGTATSGTDYTPLLSGSITIPGGQSTIDVTITPIRDNLVEGPETVVVTVQAGAGYAVGSPASGTVTIADDPAVVNVTVSDPDASETGDPGAFTFARSGGDVASPLIVNYTISGTATNGTDYASITGSITILANETTATRVIAPLADNIIESIETVTVTISGSTNYNIGSPASGSVNITDNPPVVGVAATDPNASEAGPDPGMFTFTRTGGDVSSPLQVFFTRGGTATEGVDYANLGPGSVTIPGNESFATLTVTPLVDGVVETDETVIVTISPNAGYNISAPTATVVIHDATAAPLVSVTAVDASASETGPDPGMFRFTRTGSTASALTVTYSIGGTATNGADYTTIGTTILIPVGQASADVTIAPIVDGLSEPTETVVLTVLDGTDYDVGSPASATVNIADAGSSCGPEGGPLVNGATHCGAISNAGETDTWTFTAIAGDRIAIHVGEVIDNNDFRPWIRLITPTGATLGNTSGTDAAAMDVAAPATGTYQVLVASFDSGFDGTGTYLLTMAHTPGPITISPGDQGGPLTNGAMHTGDIFQGDLDTWTFTANAGDRIGVHVGQITDTDDFRPWIRIWGPNGAVVGDTSGTDAAALDVAAPVTGTYLVLVASFDSGFDGTGTYRLTMTHTPGPITVSTDDQGGPLTNGALHTGEILKGDVDVWTFTANVGDRIGVHVGEIIDNDDFRPWIRIWAPNGAVVGNASGTDAAALDVAAPVTGTYLVLVASFDAGFDGSGTYRLTMTHTPGPITVSTGDEGGPLTNGAIHTGEILQGDVDVWTFTANAGDRIGVHVGEITDTDDFRPWIRIWAPNGAVVGDTSGVAAAALDVAAPVTGDYLVLVASFDAGFDGTGTYRLTMTHTPGPITVSADDQGGPLTNGAIHTGEILQGDVDVWTFTASIGDRIGVHVGQITDNDDFRPWIRIWAPNGAVIGDTSGTDAAVLDVAAPVSGNYLVLVASFDSGFDGTGTYRLTMTHTPGPITVSPGDEGGPLTNGATHTGEIVKGDVDVWTFTANAGERIALHVGEITDTADFRPWIRIWAPNGAVVGDTSGTDAAVLDVAAPVTGNYLVLVASFDAGFDGTGTYRLTLNHSAAAVTISPGDQGGPVTLGTPNAGEIVQGDLDVWTVSAVAGERITVQIAQTSETDDFRPWIRLWAPNGAVLGNVSGLDTTSINSVLAPVTGTYQILVGSFDSGFDGTGTYNVTVTKP
jgi:deoxycytidine triphosphate deaminase